jgi:hypothetical protein
MNYFRWSSPRQQVTEVEQLEQIDQERTAEKETKPLAVQPNSKNLSQGVYGSKPWLRIGVCPQPFL